MLMPAGIAPIAPSSQNFVAGAGWSSRFQSAVGDRLVDAVDVRDGPRSAPVAASLAWTCRRRARRRLPAALAGAAPAPPRPDAAPAAGACPERGMTVSVTPPPLLRLSPPPLRLCNRYASSRSPSHTGIHDRVVSSSNGTARFYQKADALSTSRAARRARKSRAEDTAKRRWVQRVQNVPEVLKVGSALNLNVQWVQWVLGGVASLAALVRLVHGGRAWRERSRTKNSCLATLSTTETRCERADSTGPVSRDPDLCDQLERAARNAPRAVAEGFGRYLPADFIRYLRYANGEVKEVLDALQDAVDRRYVSPNRSSPCSASPNGPPAQSAKLHRGPANVHAAERITPTSPQQDRRHEPAKAKPSRRTPRTQRTLRTEPPAPSAPPAPLNHMFTGSARHPKNHKFKGSSSLITTYRPRAFPASSVANASGNSSNVIGPGRCPPAGGFMSPASRCQTAAGRSSGTSRSRCQ